MKLKFGDGWKKVNSDKDHTTLQHDEGHQIKVRHSALSPKLRGQLASLPMLKAEGGQVEEEDDASDESARRADQDLVDSTKSPDLQRMIMMESQEKRMAEGGEAVSVGNFQLAPVSDEPKKEGGGGLGGMAMKLAPLLLAQGGQVRRYAQGTPDGPVAPNQAPAGTPININIGPPPQMPANLINPDAGAMPSMNQPQQMSPAQQAASAPESLPMGITPEMVAQATPPQGAPAEPAANPMEQQVQQGDRPVAKPYGDANPFGPAKPAAQPMISIPSGLDGAMGQYERALNQQGQSIEESGKAQQIQAQEQAVAYQKQVDALSALDKKWQNDQKAIETEMMDSYQAAKSQQINPNHYLDSKDTGARVSAAIGLILGGLGSGMQGGGPNQALEFLNKQIDRDVNAQMANMGQKNNLFKMNLEHFQNERLAAEATRMQLTAMTAAQIGLAGAKAQSPLAAQRAKFAEADLMKQAGQQGIQMAMISGVAGARDTINAHPELLAPITQRMRAMGQKDIAEDLESKSLPGVGIASVPLTTEIRSNLIAKQQFGDMLKDFRDWSAKHSGSLDPRVINEGKAKAAELQSLYRNSINGGVFKKGEQEFIDNIIDSDPNKFFNSIRVLPKLNAVLESNDKQLNGLKQSYGLPTKEAAPEIKIMGGKPYRKVPGGWVPAQ